MSAEGTAPGEFSPGAFRATKEFDEATDSDGKRNKMKTKEIA
jgi:hypothetical protein